MIAQSNFSAGGTPRLLRGASPDRYAEGIEIRLLQWWKSANYDDGQKTHAAHLAVMNCVPRLQWSAGQMHV